MDHRLSGEEYSQGDPVGEYPSDHTMFSFADRQLDLRSMYAFDPCGKNQTRLTPCARLSTRAVGVPPPELGSAFNAASWVK